MKAFDEKWFHLLTNINASDSDLKWLTTFLKVSNKEKIRFLEDEIENPQFEYLDKVNHTSLSERYLALKNKINAEEKNNIVSRLYEKKIDGQLHRLDMLQAAQNGDDASFFKAGCKVYGEPRKSYFSFVALRIIECTKVAKSTQQLAAAKRLKKIFSKIDTTGAVISLDILPEPSDMGRIGISASKAKSIFVEVLTRYKIYGWTVKIDTAGDRNRFSVHISTKTIHIPNDHCLSLRRQPMTEIRTRAVAEHEVGVHVRRSFEGGRQKLLLLSVGLQGYLRGEEGLAGYVQQQIEGATEYYGFDRYLAICMAVGMDGVERDFRSVFGIMHDYYTLITPQDQYSEKLIANTAWDVCVRIFRGTSGRSAGMVYTRGLVYLDGNIGIWKLLIERPELFELFFIGKYDPLLKSHIDALRGLDILPQW